MVLKMKTQTKKTVLHGWHEEQGAHMSTFAGYHMPLWYSTGAKEEHLAVIQGAGLFDTSHMSTLLLEGRGARDLLQLCFSKDLDYCIGVKKGHLIPGRCIYGVFLDPRAHVIDDAILYQLSANRFVVVVNAGMGQIIERHLQEQSGEGDVRINDVSESLGKIDIQGPAAAWILEKVLADPHRVFEKLLYFSFKGGVEEGEYVNTEVLLQDSTPILLSRTGYTGEFGFELFVPCEKVVDVWEQLLDVGANCLLPCGLAARDSLRVGAKLPLSHQDIGDWPFLETPWKFALPLDEMGGFTKKFIGSDILLIQEPENYTYAFAGYDPRKISLEHSSHVEDSNEMHLGHLLSCTTDMAIDRIENRIVSLATPLNSGRPKEFSPHGLACGFVCVSRPLQDGENVFLVDGKRRITIEIREDLRPDRTARNRMQSMLVNHGGKKNERVA